MFQNLCENTETAERETLSPKFTPKRGWQLPSLFFDRNNIYKIKTAVFFLPAVLYLYFMFFEIFCMQ